MHIFRSQTLQPKTFFRHPSISSPVWAIVCHPSTHQPYGAPSCHFSAHQAEWSRDSLTLSFKPETSFRHSPSNHRPLSDIHLPVSKTSARHPTWNHQPLSDTSYKTTNICPTPSTTVPPTSLWHLVLDHQPLSDTLYQTTKLFPTSSIKLPTSFRHPASNH